MQRRYIILLVIAIGVTLLIAEKVWNRYSVNWIALYEQKLGQPIEELNTTPLSFRLTEANRYQQRITTVKLKGGRTLLLGIPSTYKVLPESVVAGTVALELDDAKQRCEEALGKKMDTWSQSTVDEVTTTFVLWPLALNAVPEGTVIHTDKEPYCELVFSDQWRLNIVQPVGVIGAAP
ncbi:MAG TPA: hypothetical protein VGD69_07295 [Herpetosiphonaceae bacterium]